MELGVCEMLGNAACYLPPTLPQSCTDLTNTSANFMDSPLTGDAEW